MHECVYGMFHNGDEITKTFFKTATYYDTPKYNYIKGSLADFVDRRKGHAIHFKYCPYCGKKLNFRSIKKIATEADKRLEGE